MFALKSGQGRRAGALRSGILGMSFSPEHFVLPRWLRKPVRVFARLGSGDYSPPPFAATIATATFLSLSTLYGAYLGGHIPTFLQAMTARTGFAVDQVRVSGHHEDIRDRHSGAAGPGWLDVAGRLQCRPGA